MPITHEYQNIMKIIIQNYKSGELQQAEVPMFASRKGHIIVKTKASLLSIGTEKSMIDMAKKSLLGKALARPDWVKQVIDKIMTEGLSEAWRQSNARLEMPLPLGYSAAGVVLESALPEFKEGQPVACTGSGFASHAEYLQMPPNLCVKIPENVSFHDASYAALGGIAMEAVRLAGVEFGHKVGVIGLGLLGQLAVRILAASGCHVFGVDISADKCALAQKSGAEKTVLSSQADPVSQALEFSSGHGLDSTIIMAASKSNAPFEQAAMMTRERGVIVACGLVNLDVPRQIFFEKELSLKVSRAWGPGALEPDYTERNVAWPLPYVRWDAKRNIEEFLKMISLKRVAVGELTTHCFSFDSALEAYQMVLKGETPYLGVVLDYRSDGGVPESAGQNRWNNPAKAPGPEKRAKGQLGLGLIGAGLFARGTLLPKIKQIKGYNLVGIATSKGLSGQQLAKSGNAAYSTTDYKVLLDDPQIDAVFILTRHNSHAHFIQEALKAGKHVFVEKPLCINPDELTAIIRLVNTLKQNGNNAAPQIMTGFNRRFSPAAVRAGAFLSSKTGSAAIQIRCNAGYIPKNSWVHHPDEGGGRIIGEVCHFIDLVQYLTSSQPETVFAVSSPTAEDTNDNICVTLQMQNGMAANICYSSCGDKSYPREEVQIFAGGGVFHIHNFKNYELVQGGRKKRWKHFEIDRGFGGEMEETLNAFLKGESPIAFESIVATTLATFAIQESIATGNPVHVSRRINEIYSSITD